MAPQGDELLAAVERSPRAASAHDRAGWVGLFTSDGRVEDPVGARPHVGHTQIGRFYDTFIGPRDIVFHRDLDVVRDHVVVRDLELGVVMGWVTMAIPAYLRYDLREVDGEWKIAVLRAYWELPAMMLQFLRNGARAAPAAVQLSYALLRNQRLLGTAGFAAGFRSAGSGHKGLLAKFLRSLVHADSTAAQRMTSGATITVGDRQLVDIAEFGERFRGASWTKMIAAGSTIAVSISTGHGRGVMFTELAGRVGRITRIRYFPA